MCCEPRIDERRLQVSRSPHEFKNYSVPTQKFTYLNSMHSRPKSTEKRHSLNMFYHGFRSSKEVTLELIVWLLGKSGQRTRVKPEIFGIFPTFFQMNKNFLKASKASHHEVVVINMMFQILKSDPVYEHFMTFQTNIFWSAKMNSQCSASQPKQQSSWDEH